MSKIDYHTEAVEELEQIADLLTDNVERTRAKCQQRGVRFTLYPVGDRPSYRAEGETDVWTLITGQFSLPTTGASPPRLDASRKRRLVVDLPANDIGPRWFKKIGR